MRRLHFAVWLFASMACSALYAQSTTMEVNIPFDFRMGESLMPAGSYLVDYTPQVLKLREEHGSHAAIGLLNAVNRPTPPTNAVLEFTRYGNDYFFAKIWTPRSSQGGALPKTSLEKELASRVMAPQRMEIALHRK